MVLISGQVVSSSKRKAHQHAGRDFSEHGRLPISFGDLTRNSRYNQQKEQ